MNRDVREWIVLEDAVAELRKMLWLMTTKVEATRVGGERAGRWAEACGGRA